MTFLASGNFYPIRTSNEPHAVYLLDNLQDYRPTLHDHSLDLPCLHSPVIKEWQLDVGSQHDSRILENGCLDLVVGLHNTTPPGLVLAFHLGGGPALPTQPLHQCLDIPVAVWFGSRNGVGCSDTTAKHIARNKKMKEICKEI